MSACDTNSCVNITPAVASTRPQVIQTHTHTHAFALRTLCSIDITSVSKFVRQSCARTHCESPKKNMRVFQMTHIFGCCCASGLRLSLHASTHARQHAFNYFLRCACVHNSNTAARFSRMLSAAAVNPLLCLQVMLQISQHSVIDKKYIVCLLAKNADFDRAWRLRQEMHGVHLFHNTSARIHLCTSSRQCAAYLCAGRMCIVLVRLAASTSPRKPTNNNNKNKP